MNTASLAFVSALAFLLACGDDSSEADAATFDAQSMPDAVLADGAGAEDASADASTVEDAGGPVAPTHPNLPAGLSVLFEEDFEYNWQGTDGTVPGNWSGAGIWNPERCGIIGDATAPSGARVLRTAQVSGVDSPGGALTIHKDLEGAYDTLYVSFWMKFESGFDHNGNSEKILSFNFDATQYLFQFHWGNESLFGITPDPADQIEFNITTGLHANRMPREPGSEQYGSFLAPEPPDEVWTQYEILFERSTGEVKWWTNGELRAHHVNRTFDAITDIAHNDTWGGGGVKEGDEGRRIDAYFVAGAP